MRPQSDFEQEVAQLIVDALNLEDIGASDIDPEDALFGEGLGLDSIDALELALATYFVFVLVFAVLLWGRWRFGWRGRTAIRWTVGGFVFLMLAYFGSKLVLELILGR